MCYVIPAKVLNLKERHATVEYFGEKRDIRRDLLSLDVGDYVYVQAGMAISKIPAAQAQLILRIWEDLFEKLKNRDRRIVDISYAEIKLSKKFNALLEKVDKKQELSNSDCLYLLDGRGEDEAKALYRLANRIRSEELKNSCCIHGIVEFSNYCLRNCLYCGIRRDNKDLKRYRLSLRQICKTIDYAVNKLGFKVVVLQSGEDPFYTKSKILEIIKCIRKNFSVLIFLSLGERESEDYEAFYDAGARGTLLRFETSNSRIYEKLRPGRRLKDRLNLIMDLKNMGYLVATGFLIGLPEEEDKDILNNILLTKRIAPEMYSFGPLIPHPDTPLGTAEKTVQDKALRVISLVRLVDRKANILVTTALETLGENAKEASLNAGANSLMINLTPLNVRKFYDIYPQRAGNDLKIEEQIAKSLRLLYRLGRAPTDLGISNEGFHK